MGVIDYRQIKKGISNSDLYEEFKKFKNEKKFGEEGFSFNPYSSSFAEFMSYVESDEKFKNSSFYFYLVNKNRKDLIEKMLDEK